MEKTYEWIVQPKEPFPVSELEIKVAKGDPFTLPDSHPSLYAQVMRYWNGAQADMLVERAAELIPELQSGDRNRVIKKSERMIGDSLQHRLTDAYLEGSRLYLAMSSTSYRDFQGTNVQAIENPEFRARLMQAGLDDRANRNHHFANTLACSTVIYGGDGAFAVATLRSSKVMIYPNVYHVFGGLVETDERRSRICFVSTALTELKEEIGLDSNEIDNLHFHGIVRQGPSRIPEAILSVRFSLDQKTLECRWRTKATDKFESRRLKFINRADIPQFLAAYGQTMVPSGAAAIEEVYNHPNLV